MTFVRPADFFVRAGFVMLFALSLLSTMAFAQAQEPFTITAAPDKDLVQSGQQLRFDVNVTNNLAAAQNAQILLSGENLAWISTNTYALDLGAGKTGNFSFIISTPLGIAPKTYNYTITIRSAANASVASEKMVFFYVAEKELVEIKEFTVNRAIFAPGEEIDFGVRVQNTGTKEAVGYKVKLSVGNLTYVDPIRTLKINDAESILKRITLDRHQYRGGYTARAEVLDDVNRTLSAASVDFEIAASSPVNETRSVTDILVLRRTTITASNEGNFETVAKILEPRSALTSWFYSFDQPPDVEGSNFVWRCTLKPAESCTITFTINYWAVLLLALAGAVGIGFLIKHLTKPSLVKKVSHRKGSWVVHLDLKNRSGKPITEVEVSDGMPLAVKLLGEFTIEPSEIKKTKRGVVLVWKVGRLAPNEERVFSYQVRPALEVPGGIDLPRAQVTAKHRRGWKFVSYSSKATIG